MPTRGHTNTKRHATVIEVDLSLHEHPYTSQGKETTWIKLQNETLNTLLRAEFCCELFANITTGLFMNYSSPKLAPCCAWKLENFVFLKCVLDTSFNCLYTVIVNGFLHMQKHAERVVRTKFGFLQTKQN